MNKVDPLGLRPTEASPAACAVTYTAETSFFGRGADEAARDLTANASNPNECKRRFEQLNWCDRSGGTAWDWAGSYSRWGCGSWVKDCSSAVVQLFCERQEGLLKIGYGVLGASIAVVGVLSGNPYLVGCGVGAAGNAVFGNGRNVHRDAAGGCIAGAGAASGNPYVGCVAGALGLGVISESGGSVAAITGCIGGAVAGGVGSKVPAGERAAFLTVSETMEKVVQCVSGGAASAITNSTDFHVAWALFYGCSAGFLSASKDLNG